MLQVGQELEDVLTEKDALKAVNKELAKRVTAPGSPCARCQQARQLLLQSASWAQKPTPTSCLPTAQNSKTEERT